MKIRILSLNIYQRINLHDIILAVFGYYDEKFCNSLHTSKINSKTSEEEGTCIMYVTEEFYLHRKIYTEIFLVIGN